MKLSGNLHVSIPIQLQQKNKQTNKHQNRSLLSQPNQVQSLWNLQEIFLWVFQDDSNKKTDKLTNKQNYISLPNQVHFLWTFRKSSYGYPKMIQAKSNIQIFLINNISAKASVIFMKLSGNRPVSIPRLFKQKNYKQTNIFYLSKIKSNLYETFGESSCGYCKMIQTRNKTKPTNKKQANQQKMH